MSFGRPCVIVLCVCATACGEASADSAEQPARWQLVLADLPGSLMSVSGTAPDDVWFAGSAPEDGTGALVLHYDGEDFERMNAGVDADLWWVHAVSADQVYFGGEGGVILRYDGEHFERMPTPGSDTVFGVWAIDATRAWAVGGDPARPERAFLWALDAGSDWVLAAAPDLGVSSYFKVWGSSAEDVRVVGAEGVILHSDSTGFRVAESPAESSLTTLHVAPDGTYAAVGGLGDGVILEDAGTGWEDRTPAEAPKPLYGVWLGAETGYAVGANGTILERRGGGWIEVETELSITLDLHATWMDARGGVWAVGGDLVSSPMTAGLALYLGESVPSTDIEGLFP